MPNNRPESILRKPRADAQRNRQRIVDVAKKAFSKSSVDVSMDDIAKQARVGPGTLYRHFPTRNALLEAVYSSEVEKLATAEQRLSAAKTPVEALRSWMLVFVDYMATKQIIAPALDTLIGGPSKVYETSGAQIKDSIRRLVRRAVDSGDIRADLEPLDLLRALAGVSYVAPNENWPQNAKKMIEILISGARPIASSRRK